MLAVQPMVPENRFNETCSLHFHGLAPEGVEKLLDYVVKTWISYTAIFKHLNQYSTLGPECMWTNNNLESFHSSFAKKFTSKTLLIFLLQ